MEKEQLKNNRKAQEALREAAQLVNKMGDSSAPSKSLKEELNSFYEKYSIPIDASTEASYLGHSASSIAEISRVSVSGVSAGTATAAASTVAGLGGSLVTAAFTLRALWKEGNELDALLKLNDLIKKAPANTKLLKGFGLLDAQKRADPEQINNVVYSSLQHIYNNLESRRQQLADQATAGNLAVSAGLATGVAMGVPVTAPVTIPIAAVTGTLAAIFQSKAFYAKYARDKQAELNESTSKFLLGFVLTKRFKENPSIIKEFLNTFGDEHPVKEAWNLAEKHLQNNPSIEGAQLMALNVLKYLGVSEKKVLEKNGYETILERIDPSA